jgi:hypothetical protein
MYDFKELEERYTAEPRKMDAYLRPLTHLETGDSLPFPTVKLTLATLLITGLSYGAMIQFELIPQFVAMIGSSVALGVGIQIVRSASISERNSNLIQTVPLVYGRVIQGTQALYQSGVENGVASVIFTRDESKRRDTFYLKEVAKRLRSAIDSADVPAELQGVAELVKNMSGRSIRLPEGIAPDGDCWIGMVEVNPERLPSNKLVKQHLILLTSPEHNFVAQL